MTNGRRVYVNVHGMLWLADGDYGRDARGRWYARPPGQHMGTLDGHDVIEHEDGTITVSPSILIISERDDCAVLWHGYLERGVWRAA